ncbi:hypothetical protein PilKf_00153 [Pillotina sp. SPG140]|jgi:uncharacterized membrane protein
MYRTKNARWCGRVGAMLIALAWVSVNSPVFGQTSELNLVKPAIADRDLVISVAEINRNAIFYPVDIQGTRLEVLAVQAPDGSIRTAFNTCQVCYGSGRGFYKQQGNLLICQNCGNRFRMSQVEVRSGGCNPVPIFAANKTVNDKTITISRDFLIQAKVIFSRWSRSS